jgi:hypothetical protein
VRGYTSIIQVSGRTEFFGNLLMLLYGKRWDLFKQEGLDLRIAFARPNVATATLISGDAQFSASSFFGSIRHGSTSWAPSVTSSRRLWRARAGESDGLSIDLGARIVFRSVNHVRLTPRHFPVQVPHGATKRTPGTQR